MRGLQAAYSGVLEIVEHVFHTAVYRYFPDEQRWDRMEMEGSAYITRNYSTPLYSFIVLNKKGNTLGIHFSVFFHHTLCIRRTC